MKNALSIIGILGILFGLVILNLCFLKLSKSIIDDTKSKLIADIGAQASVVSFAQETRMEQSQKLADLSDNKAESVVELRRHHDSKEFDGDHSHRAPVIVHNTTVVPTNHTDIPIIPPRPMQPSEGTSEEMIAENKLTLPVENVVAPVAMDKPAVVEMKEIPVENKETPIVENKQVSDLNVVTPVENKAISVEAKEIPVENKSVPIETKVVAAENKALPIENNALPVENKEIAIENKAVPVGNKEATITVQSKVIPVENKEATIAVENKAAPVENKEATIAVESKVIPVENKEATIAVESKAVPVVENKTIVNESKVESVNKEIATPTVVETKEVPQNTEAKVEKSTPVEAKQTAPVEIKEKTLE
jgi:hypothetical protein